MFSKTDIEKYFLTEKNAALFFLILGIIAVLLSALLFLMFKTNWYKGFVIPVFVVGVIQGLVGYQVHKSADAYRKDAVFSYDLNPSKLETKEYVRMQKVNRQLTVLLIAEALLLMAAVLMVILLKNKADTAFWRGLALGLLLQAALSFGFDGLAKNRAGVYLNGLRSFISNHLKSP